MRVRVNASRYSRETGKIWDANLLFNLQQAAKTELYPGLPKYYFHMHEIPKVGFNLHPSYGNTPLGVYAYLLNDEYLTKLLDDVLPYRSNNPFVTILELVDPDTVLSARAIGDYRKKLLPEYTTERDRVKHLRQLIIADGYTSVLDNGSGEIHRNEPAQIAFLTSSSYKVIETFETRVLRKKPKLKIAIDDLEYNKPQFGIPSDLWSKELRLWAADCAERVLPIWESWARTHVPDQLRVPRNGILAARGFANYELSDRELRKHKDALWDAYYSSLDLGHGNEANWAARSAYWALSDKTSAPKHAQQAASDQKAEKIWQREALIQRLSQAAPSKANFIRKALT